MIAITDPDELNGVIVHLLAGARVFGSVATLCGPEGERRCNAIADWSAETAQILTDLARRAGSLPDPVTLHELIAFKATALWNTWNDGYEQELKRRRAS
ncbi:MAG: hypothetical protein ACTHMY_03470 [Solirubrobacteraceae bacterium]